MNLIDSDKLFLAILTKDFISVLQVIGKILTELFFSPDAIAIYTILILGYLIFTLRSKKES